MVKKKKTIFSCSPHAGWKAEFLFKNTFLDKSTQPVPNIPELLERPSTPNPQNLTTSLRSRGVSSTMYGFHQQSGCEEESGCVPLCEVIAQLPFAQHTRHTASNAPYKHAADGSDCTLHPTVSCFGSQETAAKTEELTTEQLTAKGLPKSSEFS